MAQFSQATRVAAITPSDTLGFAECESIWVNGPGTVSAVLLNGSTVVFNVSVNFPLVPIKAVRVNLTGTTATGLIALY